MNKKIAFQIASPVVIALILVALVMLQATRTIDISSALNSLLTNRSAPAEFEIAPLQAVDPVEYRWQAMADYYEKNGLLTRDTFDYEQAADNLAIRWQAMANYYEQNGMLTRDSFDYEQAADNLAFRWLAMAKWYEEHGMLNERSTNE